MARGKQQERIPLGGTDCRFGYRGDEVTRSSTNRERALANFWLL